MQEERRNRHVCCRSTVTSLVVINHLLILMTLLWIVEADRTGLYGEQFHPSLQHGR
jgi:hypothetical protein